MLTKELNKKIKKKIAVSTNNGDQCHLELHILQGWVSTLVIQQARPYYLIRSYNFGLNCSEVHYNLQLTSCGKKGRLTRFAEVQRYFLQKIIGLRAIL